MSKLKEYFPYWDGRDIDLNCPNCGKFVVPIGYIPVQRLCAECNELSNYDYSKDIKSANNKPEQLISMVAFNDGHIELNLDGCFVAVGVTANNVLKLIHREKIINCFLCDEEGFIDKQIEDSRGVLIDALIKCNHEN